MSVTGSLPGDWVEPVHAETARVTAAALGCGAGISGTCHRMPKSPKSLVLSPFRLYVLVHLDSCVPCILYAPVSTRVPECPHLSQIFMVLLGAAVLLILGKGCRGLGQSGPSFPFALIPASDLLSGSQGGSRLLQAGSLAAGAGDSSRLCASPMCLPHLWPIMAESPARTFHAGRRL